MNMAHSNNHYEKKMMKKENILRREGNCFHRKSDIRIPDRKLKGRNRKPITLSFRGLDGVQTSNLVYNETINLASELKTFLELSMQISRRNSDAKKLRRESELKISRKKGKINKDKNKGKVCNNKAKNKELRKKRLENNQTKRGKRKRGKNKASKKHILSH
mmetsp:Transcript_16103/g.21282  ORF Transcript_16103/g.21282 Transcript_16103/m.21282 type:complete len:161 (-) Transcript_16103:258-740(-)